MVVCIFFLGRSAAEGCDIIFNSRYSTGKDPLWTSLRPHEVDPIVILIKSHAKLVVLSNTHIVVSLPLMIIICAFVRLIFRVLTKCPQRDLISVVLDTLGMFLSTNTTNTSLRVRNRAERILNVSISLLSILTSRLLTIVFMNYIMASEIDTGLDTLKELGQTDQTIFISDEMKLTMDEWSQNIE